MVLKIYAELDLTLKLLALQQSQNLLAFLFSLGWSPTDLPRREFNQPGQVPGLHRSDPGSGESPVQVLGRPLPAGGRRGCSDGRLGPEQSRVTGGALSPPE